MGSQVAVPSEFPGTTPRHLWVLKSWDGTVEVFESQADAELFAFTTGHIGDPAQRCQLHRAGAEPSR